MYYYLIITIIIEYAWMCLNKQDSEQPQVLNMPKFWICQWSEHDRVLNRVLDRVLNIFWVLNKLVFWIWKITQGSKYATIWLNMSEFDVNMPEHVWIYSNKQTSEYVSCNTKVQVTLKVNEYLLRDIQNLVNDLRWSAFEK